MERERGTEGDGECENEKRGGKRDGRKRGEGVGD